MALTVAVSQSSGTCFCGMQLECSIILEGGRGYRNVFGTNMRFSNFRLPNVPRISSRSKHKYALKLLKPYDDSGIPQPKLLNKASVVMGYNSLNDLYKYGRADRHSGKILKNAMDDFDVSLACKRFPCITLGSSPPVGLYDETEGGGSEMSLLADQTSEAVVSKSLGLDLRVDRDGVSEAWPSLYPALPIVSSDIIKEEISSSYPLPPQSIPLETEEKLNSFTTLEESSTRPGVGFPPTVASPEPLLDKCISCVPELSKRLCRQLENCGFHTLRKLLHHFPRTYADLQNAQIDLDDGQYFIFIGEIMSSRYLGV